MTVLRSHAGGKAADPFLPVAVTDALKRRLWQGLGLVLIGMAAILGAALLSYAPGDPSLNSATDNRAINIAGPWGALFADLTLQIIGYAALLVPSVLAVWAAMILTHGTLARPGGRLAWLILAVITASIALAAPDTPNGWPLAVGLGGVAGSLALSEMTEWAGRMGLRDVTIWIATGAGAIAFVAAIISLGMRPTDWANAARAIWRTTKQGVHLARGTAHGIHTLSTQAHDAGLRLRDRFQEEDAKNNDDHDDGYTAYEDTPEQGGALDAVFPRAKATAPVVAPRPKRAKTGRQAEARRQHKLPLGADDESVQPPLELLDLPVVAPAESKESREALQQNARYLSTVLEEYGVKGEIVKVRPGPVVTLYELEPAPGTKTSRVIGLADDIARSMSAVSVRVATVPGRNVIGIELPNANRETVHLRELLGSSDFEKTKAELPLALGKDIGGAPVTVDLTKMPHLLIAGTTGSGKSVAMNTMILSLLYNQPP